MLRILFNFPFGLLYYFSILCPNISLVRIFYPVGKIWSVNSRSILYKRIRVVSLLRIERNNDFYNIKWGQCIVVLQWIENKLIHLISLWKWFLIGGRRSSRWNHSAKFVCVLPSSCCVGFFGYKMPSVVNSTIILLMLSIIRDSLKSGVP